MAVDVLQPLTEGAATSLVGTTEALDQTNPYGLDSGESALAAASTLAPTAAVVNSSSQPGSDIDGDGAVDLFWQNQLTNQAYVWYLDGTGVVGGEALIDIPSGYDVVSLNDFNDDGQTDLLLHNDQSGQVYTWYLDGATVIGFDFVTSLSTTWDLVGTGDFNSDSESDLLWYNATSGTLYTWYLEGINIIGAAEITSGLTGWNLAGTGDFNDDNQTDLVWANQASGSAYIWYLQDSTPIGGTLIAQGVLGWTIEGTGDFNDDGSSDLIWQNSTTGDLYAWYIQGTNVIGADPITQLNPVWNPIAVDRGGAPDLAVQNPTGPDLIIAGESITLGVTVSNQGSSTANASTVQYYLSADESFDPQTDVLLGQSDVAPLRSGETSEQTLSFTADSGLGSGSQYVLYVVDGANTLAEGDEANNVIAQAITVAGSDAVDLALSNVQAPAEISPGETLAVSVDVSNLGTVATPTTNVSVYLSDDGLFNNGDVLLASSALASLAVSGSTTAEFSITYDGAYGLGSKNLLFVVDDANQITEADEFNNIIATPITATPAVGPDLVVQSPSATPINITVGETLDLAATVLNTGTEATTTGSSLRYYISDDPTLDANDQLLGGSLLSTLEANGSSPGSFSVAYSALWGTGTKYVLFVADGTNAIAETSESNNVGFVEINVSPPPVPGKDLFIVESTVTTEEPGQVLYGETVDLTTVVKNQGTDLTATSNLTYYLSDDLQLDGNDIVLGTTPVAGLGSNVFSEETFSFTYSESYGSGTKYILFVADADNTVGEVDETNNISFVGLEASSGLTGPPDLTVTDLTVIDTSISVGDTLSFSVTIANQGETTAASSIAGYVISSDTTFNLLEDILLTEAPVDSLAAGATTTLTYQTTSNSAWGTGTQYLLVIPDYFNGVVEADETNNLEFVAITISP